MREVIAGPILGGSIVTASSWHWIFEINVHVGLVAVAGSLFLLPSARTQIRHGIDPMGMLLVGAGLLAVFSASSRASATMGHGLGRGYDPGGSFC